MRSIDITDKKEQIELLQKENAELKKSISANREKICNCIMWSYIALTAQMLLYYNSSGNKLLWIIDFVWFVFCSFMLWKANYRGK